MVVLAGVFVMLGMWQLRRHQEVQLENAVGISRFEADPLPLEDLLLGAGEDIESLRYRRTTVAGIFDTASEVLIRSQVYLGSAGFHIITPLIGVDDQAVLVNRGWVPLALDQVPVGQAPPPDGTVTVEGWVELTKTRGALGPVDPAEGRLVTMSRADVDRIQQQVSYELAPVYVVATGEQGRELPVPVDPPSFDDAGPHLGYAIQWFGFAAIAIGGFIALYRRATRTSS